MTLVVRIIWNPINYHVDTLDKRTNATVVDKRTFEQPGLSCVLYMTSLLFFEYFF